MTTSISTKRSWIDARLADFSASLRCVGVESMREREKSVSGMSVAVRGQTRSIRERLHMSAPWGSSRNIWMQHFEMVITWGTLSQF